MTFTELYLEHFYFKMRFNCIHKLLMVASNLESSYLFLSEWKVVKCEQKCPTDIFIFNRLLYVFIWFTFKFFNVIIVFFSQSDTGDQEQCFEHGG